MKSSPKHYNPAALSITSYVSFALSPYFRVEALLEVAGFARRELTRLSPQQLGFLPGDFTKVCPATQGPVFLPSAIRAQFSVTHIASKGEANCEIWIVG